MLFAALINQQLEVALYQMTVYLLLLFVWSGYRYRKVLLFILPFLLIFISSTTTMILFGKGVNVWWQWGLIKISEESFRNGLMLGFKTVSLGTLGMIFALTTRPTLFFYALMQQFRLAPKYAYSFIAAIRLLPMVWEELYTRANALEIRGVRYSKGLRGVYERLSLFAVPLLAQAIRRAQRVAVAMEAKRFQIGASRTYYYRTSYSSLDVWFALLMLGLGGAAYFIPL
jgi:energy-coupling factor transport system permease protein